MISEADKAVFGAEARKQFFPFVFDTRVSQPSKVFTGEPSPPHRDARHRLVWKTMDGETGLTAICSVDQVGELRLLHLSISFWCLGANPRVLELTQDEANGIARAIAPLDWKPLLHTPIARHWMCPTDEARQVLEKV